MLIALDPQSSIPVVLENYKELENPPTFLVNFPSARKAAGLKQFIQRLKTDECISDFDAVDMICDQLEPYVVGWNNVDETFTARGLGDALVDTELYELLAKVTYGRIDPTTAKN